MNATSWARDAAPEEPWGSLGSDQVLPRVRLATAQRIHLKGEPKSGTTWFEALFVQLGRRASKIVKCGREALHATAPSTCTYDKAIARRWRSQR